MRVLSILLLSLIPFTVAAQLTVPAGSAVKITGQISTRGSVNNNSSLADFSTAHLFLTGSNQTLATISPVVLQGLTIDGGGTKTAAGEWTVTRDLTFTQGIFTPGSGKLTYSGTTTLNGNVNSFVNGTLFQRGTGSRFFPIGVANAYIPLRFNDVQDAAVEVGVTAFTGGTNLVFPPDVKDITNNRYWELSTSGGSLPASTVSLYVPGSSVELLQPLVVIEADNISGATAINMGGGALDQFVTSFSTVSKPIVTIGLGENIDLKILDLITPYNEDLINDKLQIVNVDYVVENKVTLLDRWGVVVKEWTNYRNDDNFDFSTLSPGNYICVMEYQLTPSSPKVKLSQMVSILKAK